MATLLLNTHQTDDYFYCSKSHWFTDCDLFENVSALESLIILIRPTYMSTYCDTGSIYLVIHL